MNCLPATTLPVVRTRLIAFRSSLSLHFCYQRRYEHISNNFVYTSRRQWKTRAAGRILPFKWVTRAAVWNGLRKMEKMLCLSYIIAYTNSLLSVWCGGSGVELTGRLIDTRNNISSYPTSICHLVITAVAVIFFKIDYFQ